MKKLMFAAVAAVAAAVCAFGATYCVDIDSKAENPDGQSWENAYADIQSAIAAASRGDTILVAKGHYKLTEPITADMRLVLKSVDGPSETIIDGQGVTSCVRFTLGSNDKGDVGGQFLGFTVTNGYGKVVDPTKGNPVQGAGLYVYCSVAEDHPYFVISNCIVAGCVSAGSNTSWRAQGGGIYMRGNVDLVDCEIHHCAVTNLETASYSIVANAYGTKGGGIFASAPGATKRPMRLTRVCIHDCTSANPAAKNLGNYGSGMQLDGSGTVLTDCVFKDNFGFSPLVCGAGLCVNDAQTAYLTNCVFSGNLASKGDGSALRIPAGEVVGCSFIDNTLRNTSGVAGGAAIVTGSALVKGCYFKGNSALDGCSGIVVAGAKCRVEGCYFEENSVDGNTGCVWAQNNYSDNDADMVYVRDCAFVSNSASLVSCVNSSGDKRRACVEGCVFAYNKTTGPSGRTVGLTSSSPMTHLRNSLFYGNEDKQTVYLCCKTGVVENCTVVGNTLKSGGVAVYLDLYNTVRSDATWLVDTLVSGNSVTNAATESNVSFVKLSAVNVSNCWCRTQGTDVSAYFTGNNSYYCADDLKTDGYVPTRKSPLRDKGVRRDWMGADAKDVGDGTFTLTFANAQRKTGLKLSFNNRHPRVYGTAPDIGACEYFCPPGLTLLLK